MEAQPKSMEKLEHKRDYEIDKKTGDVTLIETLVTKLVFPGREFITYKRQHEQFLEQQQRLISEETIKGIKANIAEVEDQMKPLGALMAQVDKITKRNYEDDQRNAKLGFIVENIEKPDIVTEQKKQLVGMYDSLPTKFQKKLSKEQRIKIHRLKKSLKK